MSRNFGLPSRRDRLLALSLIEAPRRRRGVFARFFSLLKRLFNGG